MRSQLKRPLAAKVKVRFTAAPISARGRERQKLVAFARVTSMSAADRIADISLCIAVRSPYPADTTAKDEIFPSHSVVGIWEGLDLCTAMAELRGVGRRRPVAIQG